MIQRGFKPDIKTYNSIVDGYCFQGEIDEEGKDNGCESDVSTYNILINGYCTKKMINEALILFEEMKSKGVVLDATVISPYKENVSCSPTSLEKGYM